MARARSWVLPRRNTIRELTAAELRARVLRAHVTQRLTLKTIAAEFEISVARVKEIVNEAIRDAVRERLDLAEYALDLELDRLTAIKREASAVLHGWCPACEARHPVCTVCRGEGREHPVGERLLAMDRYMDALLVEESLLGSARRAVAYLGPRPEEVERKFWMAAGEFETEDLHAFFDAYLSARFADFGAQVIQGSETQLPRFSALLREAIETSNAPSDDQHLPD